jgi:NAD(P)-dependent dehydrogenase (short-subunit alcohol dehydrogenase family)
MTESAGNSEGRVWFITGTSTGFGRALAEEVLEHGDRVVATARDPEQVREFEQDYPERARAVRLDVTDKEEVHEAIEATIEAFGQIDVVVNNASYGLLGAIEEVSEEDMRRQIEINLFGVLNVTRAVLPHMRQRRSGHFVNISSVGGFVGVPGFGIYNATKFGVEGLSEGLALGGRALRHPRHHRGAGGLPHRLGGAFALAGRRDRGLQRDGRGHP